MRLRKWIFLGLVVCLVGRGVVFAEDSEPSESTPPALSVYKINPWVDGSILLVAAAGAGLPPMFEDDLIKKTEFLRREDINRFDRSNVKHHSKTARIASDYVVAAALITPAVMDFKYVGWNKTLAEDMIVYTQTLAINSSINNLARFTAQRARPDAYRKPQPRSEAPDFESFLSGHAASAFAGLTAASWTIHYRYGPQLWPWLVTGGVGITEAALRSLAGRHFYTDGMLAMATGTLVGTAVPWLHHRKPNATSRVYPTFGDQEAGLVWEKKF